jgi:integrase/recombinase XerD
MTKSNKTIRPLRQRMLEDMAIRKLGAKTQKDYIRAVVNFTCHLKRSPDTATAEDLRDYHLHMANQRVSSGTVNSTISGLKFFFDTTLDRVELVRKLRYIHEPRKLPKILSVEEVTRLIQAAQAALSVAYEAGLRANEITHLKVSDIDSERMILRVEQGKGGRDRHAMLSPQLLDILRRWYRDGQLSHKMLPGGWLFPGQNPVNPLSAR